MTWHATENADECWTAAGDFLRARPVENTVLLTLVTRLRQDGPYPFGPGTPLYGWHRGDAGAVDGAFLHTPPYPMFLSALPPGAATTLARHLTARDIPGVNALTADATAFAATRPDARIRRQSRLYRLDVLAPPPTVPGTARIAGPADRDLLTRWWAAFHEEVGEPHQQVNPVDERLTYGGVTLWTDGDHPVSMAAVSRPEAGTVRVTTVYTPPDRRGHGYAAAATAAVTRAALDAGATDVVLNTDLANRTSNALYQRLGYRPVEDRIVMEFPA